LIEKKGSQGGKLDENRPENNVCLLDTRKE
jgi:hypothetical protein